MSAPTSCARCSASFGCGAQSGGCWCNDVATSPAVLAELARRFDGCLCPGCLRALAATPIAAPAHAVDR